MITGVASLAIDIFGEDVTVYEETSTRIKGRVQSPTVSEDRCIWGCIQPAGDLIQQQRPTGSKTDGELILQTMDTVYYRDVKQSGDREQKQTFVRHQNDVWRVVKPQNWSNHSGARRYVLTRFVRDE